MKKQIIILTLFSCCSLLSAQIVDYPHAESFETAPTGWSNIATSGNLTCGNWEYGTETGTPNTGPNYASDGSSFLFLDANNCNTTTTVYATSPQFSLLGLKQPTFTFDHFRYGSNIGDMDVEVSTDGGSQWVSLLSSPYTGQIQSTETDAWEEVSLDLSAYIDEVITLRFSGQDLPGGLAGDIAIDNIVLLDAGIISGNGDVAYFYDAAGNRTRRAYTITSMAQSEQQVIAAARSVEDGSQVQFLDDDLFKVYPNPAKHFIQIESVEPTGPTTVHLLDAAGRELHIAHMTDDASLRLDMSSYQPGVYVLWIQMEDRVVSRKIIKH